MKGDSPSCVLDSFALLAYFGAEPGESQVKVVLTRAAAGQAAGQSRHEVYGGPLDRGAGGLGGLDRGAGGSPGGHGRDRGSPGGCGAQGRDRGQYRRIGAVAPVAAADSEAGPARGDGRGGRQAGHSADCNWPCTVRRRCSELESHERRIGPALS